MFFLPIVERELRLYPWLCWLADLAALGWMGIWFGLSAKKPGWAPALNLVIVLALPPFFFCVPRLVIDVCFIVYARSKLSRDFRSVMLRELPVVSVKKPRPVFLEVQGETIR